MGNQKKQITYFLFIQILILIYFKFFYMKVMEIIYQKKIKQIKNSNKISVLILNYDRPHNLRKSLPVLSNYDTIDQIVVSHGHPDYYEEFNFPKVDNVKDFENNKLYGCGRRFLTYKKLKNDIVLVLDDDILPKENLINYSLLKLFDNYKKNTIFGLYSRSCNEKGYYFGNQTDYNKKPNIVLTPYIICKKKIIRDYVNQDVGFNKYKEWINLNKGNCEDLAFNLFVNEYYNELPIHIVGSAKSLDEKSGYSSSDNHWTKRKEFCEKYSKYPKSQSFYSLSYFEKYYIYKMILKFYNSF